MPKKYKIVCLSISAIFLILNTSYEDETIQPAGIEQSPAAKVRRHLRPMKRAADEDVVAAILIMPKSYLPALKQFSNSAMAKDITILQAQIELKDGQMTAVHYRKDRGRSRKMAPVEPGSGRQDRAGLENPPEIEKRVVVSGIIYLLANIQKGASMR